MSKKKILFITGEFLPYTTSIGGVIRVISFLKSLKNFNIKLLSIKKKRYGYFGFKKNINNINKIYIRTNSFQKNFFRSFIIKILKKLFSNILYVLGIDNNFFYLNRYSEKTKEIIGSFKPDFIIISAPPFSLFKLVNGIKKNFGNVKIILDYMRGILM